MDKPIRTALIGCGQWGRHLARNLAEEGALSVICDHNPHSTEIAEHLGVQRVAEVDDPALEDVDAWVIATPPPSHYELAKRALEASMDVFVEKPLALDLGEAGEIAGIAESTGRIVMTGHVLRFHPAFEAFLSEVRAGRIGRIQHIHSSRLNFGKIWSEADALWDLAPHDFSMILALAGDELPRNMAAHAHFHVNDDVADIVTAHMSFPGRLTADVLVSWLHPYKEQKLSAIGEKGMLVFDDVQPEGEELIYYRHVVNRETGYPVAEPADAEHLPYARAEPLAEEIRHFIECVRTRARPRTNHTEGLRVLRALTAAQQSLETGTTVTL